MKIKKKNFNKNNNLSQWEKRVVIFKFIYSIIIDEFITLNTLNQKIKSELPNDEYILLVINNFINNKDEYSELLQKNLKENWTVKRLDYVDKAIIFSAISEFKAHNIDRKIIIDQSIITAKNYGTDVSYKFINFILDKVIK